MKLFYPVAGAVMISLALVACKQAPESAPTASELATQPVPAPMPDKLDRDQVKYTFSLEGEPKFDAEKSVVQLTVKISNEGTAILSGSLSPAVNLGVQVLGDDGTLASAGSQRDYFRKPLPEIAPGTSVSVALEVPVDARANDRKLRLDMVQERVIWFSDWSQPTLEFGPYDLVANP